MKHATVKKWLAAVLVTSSVFFVTPAFAAAPEPAVINVTGYAQQEVAPDTAYITIGMESTDGDAQKARSQNNVVMNQVSSAVQAMGIAKTDMKTTGFNISPNYDEKNRNKIVSYTVTNNLQIKVTDLDMVTRIISKAGNAGANNVRGLRFTTERADQIRSNLIKEAVVNGRRAADAAATAAGGSLGRVKEINVSGNSPSYERSYGMQGINFASAKMADSTPIEAGTTTMSETVTMTFYIE
ncbi:MAG: SIMPL domain-containing protein [Megasphaera sp.]|jgi:uncharacterized protein YggE|nr:SIMPL domain-containing protein [Megasphaera sp.]MCI1247449.1 SIMPL domain-containing protein [Megasphaera sp.]